MLIKYGLDSDEFALTMKHNEAWRSSLTIPRNQILVWIAPDGDGVNFMGWKMESTTIDFD